MFAFTPLFDYLLVEPIPESASMQNGLHLPMATGDDQHKFPSHMHGKLLRGKVLAAGPGDICKKCHGEPGHDDCQRCFGKGRLPMNAKAGDTIIYPHREAEIRGLTVTREGREYLLINEEQWCVGVIEA
jgi:co-chaperonin GroES (HSP10)